MANEQFLDVPEFLIDDLSIPPYTQEMKDHHEEPRSYNAVARQGDVQASLTIRRAMNPLYPGGYMLADQATDRVDPFAPGRMGKKQEARAHMLQPLLHERVEAALLTGGWEQRWKASHGASYWFYVGTDTATAEPAGSKQRVGDPTGADVEQEDQVEELVIDQTDQPGLRQSHIVLVVGSEEAKGRGQQPAYSREVFTRPVTFTCIVCGKTVTQQRFPGNPPLYCSDSCKAERQREKTKERVAKHRKEKKKVAGNNSSQDIVTS